ncbi:hypothetical protein [Propionispira raffinosivorans]|uniref:hypothetical protein n=1 Tax=Propionispira raffinosivorans TaxID=86959 RepID=UPI0003684E94|nr:hypothetical protein [Propionispira raffinosivorans]
MDTKISDKYIAILKEELVPALGCTEPIAIAYIAACILRYGSTVVPEKRKPLVRNRKPMF